MTTSEEKLIKALLSVEFDLLFAICVDHGVSRAVASEIVLEYFEKRDDDEGSREIH